MLTTSDFTGYFKLPFDNSSKEVVANIIEQTEFKYLVDMLGVSLYNEFIADLGLNPEPTQQKFKNIFGNLFVKNNVVNLTDGTLASSGIKYMLKGFVYFTFANEFNIIASQTGFVSNKNENSEKPNQNFTLEMIEDRYNRGIDNYKAIQCYIKENLSIYPNYCGIDKDKTYWGGAF